MSVDSASLVIIQRFEDFINYIYPKVQNIDRTHGYIKQKFINLLFEQVECLYRAIKTNQISKYYEADANMASIRFYMRFFTHKERKLISLNQATHAGVLLAEVGKILGSAIKNKANR